jgi:hypothetical protein
MNKQSSVLRRASSLALLLTAGAALFAPACSSEDPAPTTGGPIDIEAYREELEKARCEFLVRCGFMQDAQTCQAVVNEDQATAQLLADVVFNKVTFDPAAARTCVDATRAQGCEGLASVSKAVGTACAGVFKGSVAEGGACLVGAECAGEGRCDRMMCMDNADVCCMGTCAKPPDPVAVGGDCSVNPCVETAYCDAMTDAMGTVTGTCKERVKNGQPCTSKFACEEGLRCDEGGDGNCYTLSKEGQPCNPNLQNGACLRVDNWCHTTDKMCSKLPLPGEPCTDKMLCMGHAYCNAGTCQVRALEGQDCKTDGTGAPCLGDLACKTDEMMMKSICVRPEPKKVCVAEDTGG